MDAKDLRTVTALSERSDDGNKYARSGTIQCNKNNSYQDIGSNSSVKVDTANTRPCAVIGPDRVLPPSDPSDVYLKKASIEPWPCSDNTYQRPNEYHHKIASYQNPSRNISPRQTFQENMQRIMVAPTYNTVKTNDETTYLQLPDRNIPVPSNSKMGMSSDSKYCDVPYTIIPTNNDSKNIRNPEMCVPNMNPSLTRSAPHGWPPGTLNVHPQKPYTSSEVYPYPEYPSCAGPRHVPIPRPHRTVPDEPGYMYPESHYQESNIRFKPYPNVKERYQQTRYEYINNYSNPFHPPPFLAHKYDLQKPMPPRGYPGYPHFKYIDSRISEPILDSFQRPINQQSNYSMQYHNQILHPVYGPMMSSCSQGKIPPYPPDGSSKQIPSNKLPYDNNKMYINYENARIKPFPSASDHFYSNETSRIHPIKTQGIMPNYSPMMHTIPPHPYYKKENALLKSFDYANHYKNMNQSIHTNPGSRHMPQFSPNSLPISPTDSTASNDTMKTQGTTQEDCGYVSQSSTTSIRSMDSGIQRINDYYGRYDYRYRPIIRTSPNSTKSNVNTRNSIDSKEKKDIDVRQFLQMWNEGDEENVDTRSNKESAQTNSIHINYLSKQHEAMTNQEQLYVLGLVNVPSEELSKYQHIQRVSKLPENIKGYNTIELLNQFEKAIESSKNYQMPSRWVTENQTTIMGQRPVSPLDVESKISQSIIHKEVGCNFEIKPCSPKMLNVEIAGPVHNILTERVIEKVTNPLSTVINSPILPRVEENINECKVSKRQDKMFTNIDEISSCKMKNTQFSPNNIDSVKNNYTVQDLESNLGVCLASLPRLDNDIELNFPEVNQQFINANKVEAVNSTSMKDLPDLDLLDQTVNVMHIETLTTESKIKEEYPNKTATEKEFRKLSQYRKTKLYDSETKEEKLNPLVVRTDSVIIKNPENTKSLNTLIGDDQETPINLTSPNVVTNVNKSGCDKDKPLAKEVTEDCPISDIAVDFSLNKSSHEYFSCNNSKSESTSLAESTLQNETLSKASASKDPSLFSNYQDTDLIQSNVVPCTYNICEVNESNPIFDCPAGDLSITNNIYKNIENNKQYENISEQLIEIQSVSDNTELKSADHDIINEICSPALHNKISDHQKVCEVKNNCEEQISSCLSDENMHKNSLIELISGKKVSVEVPLQNKDMIENKEVVLCHSNVHDLFKHTEKAGDDREINITEYESGDMKELSSIDIKVVQIDTELTLAEVILHDNNKESYISDTKTELNYDDATDDEGDNGVKGETEITQYSKPSNFGQVSSLREKNIMECSELESELATETQNEIFQKELSLTRQSSSNEETFKDEILLTEINVLPSKNHEYRLSLLENITSEYESYNSLLYADDKVNIKMDNHRNKLGYLRKKLYSPWIQKLLMYNEGPFSPIDKISTINDVIESQNVQICTNDDSTKSVKDTNCGIDKEDIFLNNVLLSNTDSVDDDLNSKDDRTTISSFAKAKSDRIDIVTKETDEVLSTIEAKNCRTHEIITAQVCLDMYDKQKEREPTINTNSKNEETLLRLETNQQKLSSERNDLVLTSINVDDIETMQNENEREIQQDECKNNYNSDNLQINVSHLLNKPQQHSSLKRSLSDSAINQVHTDFQVERKSLGNTSTKWPFKRKKSAYIENADNSNLIAQKLCNIFQNRRNSISSIYNDENVSFCILIDDNCIIAEEDEEVDKICYAEYSDDCLEIANDLINEEEATVKEEMTCSEEKSCTYSESFMLECVEEKSLGECWVQDVGCVETVVSDDIAEDIVISAPSSPKNIELSDNAESGIYSNDLSEHTEKVKYIYGDKMCSDDAHFVETLYNTPQMDVNKTLITRDPHVLDQCNRFYDTESLEKILSESNSQSGTSTMVENSCSLYSSGVLTCHKTPDNKENMNISTLSSPQQTIENNKIVNTGVVNSKISETTQDGTVNSCESSNGNVFSSNHKDENIHYTTSSSPEVSSTTSEERNSSILLKITNYNGSITSEINQITVNTNKTCCKFTEKHDYLHSNAVLNSTRPLITKAAQKYIPPLKESIRDLKVKLPLSQQTLIKFKQLKLSKDEPKVVHKYNKNIPTIPKKPKPKFEDVLKSIDEIQFKMHKQKNKKCKTAIPKVVIKKSENGSHYASTSNQDTYNPDLTGRKWQPWVFLEKNNFIDKMAIKKKTKAVFSYRKNNYVLAEKFYKYKSVNSTKFFITQPKFNALSTGQLKYTIRLKHDY